MHRATPSPGGLSCQALLSHLAPPPLRAHIGADLRQPGEQVQHAGDRADDKANDFLPSEGLERQKGVLRASRGRRYRVRSPRSLLEGNPPTQVVVQGKALDASPSSPPLITYSHLTLLPGSTDRSLRPLKTLLGAATEPALLSSGVVHTSPKVNKSRELMGADTGHEAGGKPKLGI